ncbi:hypothetical protein DFH94DRAFT_764493 [Russula ochroleuca]|uniref:Secreted protein n=1 Tax=Russula ochroleuca TaxID=152965 RepID=A0A9P5JZ20_9AGAM|nr:hypothetical protein DFH94DRAFT_764493 [Russula ochroleuca]
MAELKFVLGLGLLVVGRASFEAVFRDFCFYVWIVAGRCAGDACFIEKLEGRPAARSTACGETVGCVVPLHLGLAISL